MKVYIFTDMEGIGGIVDWQQALPDGPDYATARLLLTEEVNAAVAGAIEGGATEVIVRDGHYMGRNFLVDKLKPGAKYYMGRSPGYVRMPEIKGSDLMLCVGYHSKVNTHGGILGHTMDGHNITVFRANGVEMGELGMDALWAGLEGVGVGMVSGDDHLAEEARALLGSGVETAVVKRGFAKYGGLVMSPEDSRRLILETAASAVKKAEKKKPKPFKIPPPYKVELDVVGQEFVEKKVAMIPGAKVVGASTVVVEGDDLNYLMFAVLG